MKIFEKLKIEREKRKDPLYSMKFGGSHNIEEFLHGYCDLFLAYFLQKMSGWTGQVMIRPSNKMIIHAYATRINEDGGTEYADARGIFLNEKEFFRPYWFRKRDVKIHSMTEKEIEDSLARMREKGLEQAIMELFNYVYG